MRESQVERRKGEKMSKVIRLSDMTIHELDRFKETLSKYYRSKGLEIDKDKNDDSYIKNALSHMSCLLEEELKQ